MDNELRKKFFEQLDNEISFLIDQKTGLVKNVYTQKINCPLCEAKPHQHDLLFTKNGFKFVRCMNCCLIFTNPQIRQDIIESIYEDSLSASIWSELQQSPEEEKWKTEYFKNNLNAIIEYVEEPTHANLLDVGCSNGNFLSIVSNKKPSWNCQGIDLSKEATQVARDKGLNVQMCKFENFKSKNEIDIITLFGVVEHLPNPKELLTQIYEYSKEQMKGVTVCAIVPNAFSFYHMMLQEKSVSFDGRDHLIYYSEKTLSILFEKCGFKNIKIDTVLDGLPAIKRQMQWINPNDYTNDHNNFFVNEAFKKFVDSKAFKSLIQRYNLGLRLRIIAQSGE